MNSKAENNGDKSFLDDIAKVFRKDYPSSFTSDDMADAFATRVRMDIAGGGMPLFAILDALASVGIDTSTLSSKALERIYNAI